MDEHVLLVALRQHLAAGHLSRRAFVRRASALGFGLPAIAGALTACGGGSEATPGGGAGTATGGPITVNQNLTATPAASPTAAASTGKAGGTFTFARLEDSNNLDPVTTDLNVNIWIFMNCYDQLIRVAESGVELMPGLAERWEASSDGMTYTFHLRAGVKFYDGSPLTASDVKWSLERAKTSKDSPWTFTLEAVQDISTPDDQTVVVKLSQPWAPFLADIAMFNSSVVSAAFAKDNPDKLKEQTMGTGPFHLKEWRKGEFLHLVKNPNYWEPGLPLLDEIKVMTVPDDNSRILQLQGGQVDGMYNVPFNRINDLAQDPKLQVLKFTSTYNNYVALNTRQAPLNDVKFRQALNYATDKKALIDTVFFGNAEVSNSFMPNGALYWNKDLPGYPFDLAKAKELIAQSSSPNGAKLEIQIIAGAQTDLQVATALKDMWKQIGVDLEISQLDQGVYYDNYNNNKFQTQLVYWTNDIIDPDELVSYAITPENAENFHTGWVNQEAVDLAKKGRTTLDPEERRKIYYRIQEINSTDAPFVFLYVLPYVDVVTKQVKNFFQHPMGHWQWKRTSVER
ncbi:MAG: ABC transporter substrate-binding protein [Thermomicrobiaceae bacterium]|nr:ABC transporter substrate-binding protein [Thermomicrobiaceae bacterium]